MLTTHLGQVVEITKQLGEVMRIPVDINDRDMKNLNAGGIDIEVQSVGDQKQQQAGLKSEATGNDPDDRIHVSTVDNFQGDENKMVVVSLVRSNSECQIRFLKEPERLTVLLSRAQCLLILIGNGDCLRSAKNAKCAELWERLLSFLEKQGQVASGLPVKCASHDRCNILSKKEEFEKIAPNGGCTLECTAKLSCGHRCPLKCHVFDFSHKSVSCNVRVPFLCPKGHNVFGVCSEVAEKECSEQHINGFTCKYCELCNEIARIEKSTEEEVARIKAAEQEKLRHEELKQACRERDRGGASAVAGIA